MIYGMPYKNWIIIKLNYAKIQFYIKKIIILPKKEYQNALSKLIFFMSSHIVNSKKGEYVHYYNFFSFSFLKKIHNALSRFLNN